MSVIDRLYDALPERARPLAKQGYYLLHPAMSWRKIRKVDRVTASFVDRFFDDEAEYERYRREFFEGRIVEICKRAQSSMPDDESIYDAHRDQCAKLYALIRKRKPRTVVETGVYHGVSTTSTLLALDRNDRGTLHSIDNSYTREAVDRGASADRGTSADRGMSIDPSWRRARPSCAEAGTHVLPPETEPGWIVPDDLRARWELVDGRPRRALDPLLRDVGETDVFVHDSEHSTSGMLFEFELAWEWLAPGGVLLSSHVDWNDGFETFVADRRCEHGIASFEYNGREDYDLPCSVGYAIKDEDARTTRTSRHDTSSSDEVTVSA